jgi:hypothetical protein
MRLTEIQETFTGAVPAAHANGPDADRCRHLHLPGPRKFDVDAVARGRMPDLGRACDRSLAGSSADDPERDDNTAIDTARLQTVGYHGQGWWRYVLPGLGLLDWAKFLRQARFARHHDVISVEHEDAEFGWPRGNLDLCKDGETQALRYLERTLATL